MSYEPKQVSGARQLFVRAGGFLTRCLIAGPEDGEVVLLLHDAAFGGSSDVTWRHLIPLLAERYRVVAPDYLGYGGTDKAVFLDQSQYDFRIRHFLALLDVLAIDGKFHAVGNSFGGSMALHMLRHCPQRLASATSIAGAAGGWRTDFGREVLARWDGTKEGLADITSVLVDRTEEFDFDAHLEERFFWATRNGHYRAVMAPSVVLPGPLASDRDKNVFPSFRGCDVPVLLVAGTHDAILEPDWPAKISPFLPPCEIVTLECKHAPNLDRLSLCSPVLSNWLKRHTITR